MANRLVKNLDRQLLGAGEVRRLGAPIQPNNQQAGRLYAHDADCVLRAWRDAVHAPTERGFEDLSRLMQLEFADQQGRYLELRMWRLEC